MGEFHERVILTVNADEAHRCLVGRYLRQAGFVVREAPTGAEALACVAREPPDLVVLDVELPDMSGYCLGRTLWEDPATSAIRLLYTADARASVGRRLEGLEAGGDASMTHPVDRDQLVTTVSMLLCRPHDERQGRAPWLWPWLPDANGEARSSLFPR